MLWMELERIGGRRGGGGERCVNLGWKGRHRLPVIVAAERGIKKSLLSDSLD